MPATFTGYFRQYYNIISTKIFLLWSLLRWGGCEVASRERKWGREGLHILHCDFSSLEIPTRRPTIRWICSPIDISKKEVRSDCWARVIVVRTNRTSRPSKLLTNPSHAPDLDHAHPAPLSVWEEEEEDVSSQYSVLGRQFNHSAEKGNNEFQQLEMMLRHSNHSQSGLHQA